MLSSLAWIALSLAAAPSLSVPGAIAAIADDQDTAAAIARLRQAGKPGLWALADAAKKASGKAKGRLFLAIGGFGGPEAEWALFVELKDSDPEGVAGAVRGLGQGSGPSSCSSVLSLAGSSEGIVRDAVVEALVQKKGCGAASIKRLYGSPSELGRETALRYVVAANDPVGAELQNEALGDASGRVRAQAAELAAVRHDKSQLYTLSDIAKGPDEAAGQAAARAITAIGGFSAPNELAAVIADARTTQPAWRAAALGLRTLGNEGYRALLKGMARTKDPARREAVAEIAAHALSDADVQAAVELLEDAELSLAGAAILDRAGDRAVSIAEARRASALPELEAGIVDYLKHRSARPPQDLAAAAPAE
ncbi:MAG: hypothetical protein U1E65_28925 [Myxococcota bacterium]